MNKFCEMLSQAYKQYWLHVYRAYFCGYFISNYHFINMHGQEISLQGISWRLTMHKLRCTLTQAIS